MFSRSEDRYGPVLGAEGPRLLLRIFGGGEEAGAGFSLPFCQRLGLLPFRAWIARLRARLLRAHMRWAAPPGCCWPSTQFEKGGRRLPVPHHEEVNSSTRAPLGTKRT